MFTTFDSLKAASTGVYYPASYTTDGEISDGFSNTLIYAEKYINPDAYATGTDNGDNEFAMEGDNEDIVRWTATSYPPPCADTPGYSNTKIFGSSNSAGFNGVLCDGSVHSFNYSIDREVLRRLGNRRDGLVVDGSKF